MPTPRPRAAVPNSVHAGMPSSAGGASASDPFRETVEVQMSSLSLEPIEFLVSCQAKYTSVLVAAMPTLNLLSMLFDHTPLDRSMPRSFTRSGLDQWSPWSVE